MILCRRVHPVPPLNRAFRRHLSSNPYNSIPKLRVYRAAYPFNVTPTEAVKHLAPWGALVSQRDLLSSFAAQYLPDSLGFEGVKPEKITPVYFPAWIIDAEVKADVVYKGDEFSAAAQFFGAYLPGSEFSPLCTVPLYTKEFSISQTVPFSQDLTTIDGVDVSCLPYTLSPLGLPSYIRSLGKMKTRVTDELSVELGSVQPSLMAAYPVLIPLYIAQYKYTHPKTKDIRTCTMFMEAHSRSPIIVSENTISSPSLSLPFLTSFHHLREALLILSSNALARRPVHPSNAPKLSVDTPLVMLTVASQPSLKFVRVPCVSLVPVNEARGWVRRWVEGGVIGEMEEKSGKAMRIDEGEGEEMWKDKRIREFTKQERGEVRKWLEVGAEEMMVDRVLYGLRRKIYNSPVQIKSTSPEEMFEVISKRARESRAEIDERRRGLVPGWWKEWVEEQEERKENEVQKEKGEHK